MGKRELSSEEVRQLGFTVNHEQKGDGGNIYQFPGPNGSAYTHITAGQSGWWEKAHFHGDVHEFCIVQVGRVALASFCPSTGGLKVSLHVPGETIISEPGVAHNLFFFPDTVVNVVHFFKREVGKVGGHADWHACPGLEKMTESIISKKDVLNQIKRWQRG